MTASIAPRQATQPDQSSSSRPRPLPTGGAGVEPSAQRPRLTAAQAARVLHISQSCVTKQARLGKLIGDRIDGRWYFTPAAVLAYRSTFGGDYEAMCQHCHAPFWKRIGGTRYCSTYCRDRHWQEAKTKAAGGYGSIGVCEVCRGEFTRGRQGHRFCCDAHRQIGFYRRHGFDPTVYNYGAVRAGGHGRFSRGLDGKVLGNVG